jgi:DNA replication protein DnaC
VTEVNDGVNKLDKYEYNLKLEEIDKLVDQGDYTEAANMADTIDWKRVRNIRTLCMISEIYEAADRLEDSKAMLVRAYRKSPVGRTVLYRLVEVTTALGQYDEAIEYYTEYVQAAPHDNNRYILKYQIYKGRGNSIEELITILEEYLGQEYTERWAYELATLYQQSGQMQKCFAACDDLVLWFHSGKYVRKALELKKRYTTLTPKQQQLYEECMQEQLENDLDEADEEETVIQNVESTDGEVLAESIMAETEKEIASQVAAHKAKQEREAAGMEDPETVRAEVLPGSEPTRVLQREDLAEMAAAVQREKKRSEEAVEAEQNEVPAEEADASAAETVPEAASAVQGADRTDTPAAVQESAAEILQETEAQKETQSDALVDAEEPAQETAQEEPKDLQVELAKSMRKIISGVVKQTQDNEDDIPASVDPQIQKVPRLVMPEVPERTAAQLSIDDVLLSMSDKGKRVADVILGEEEKAEEADEKITEEETVKPEETAGSEVAEEDAPLEVEKIPVPDFIRSVTAAETDELTDVQREALQYTSHPEKLLRNRHALPTYAEETAESKEAENKEEDELAKTRRIVNTKEELIEAAKKELLAEKTIRIPTEEISRRMAAAAQPEQDAEEAPETVPSEYMAEEAAATQPQYEAEEAVAQPEDTASEAEQDLQEVMPEEDPWEETSEAEEYDTEEYEEEEPFDEEEEEYLMIPDHLRSLFSGFTEIEGLEDQIANAIIQAEAKGADRTSRSGNILIFGAHGSGKTTLAMNIAKAIAQDKGTQVMKVAKIYAADLNRKDIAATVAKIAGGTLIIEEAGDLEQGTVEQLTTAMEFRTDGLVVILEDEQQYIHELLMKHPRFTMKFTAQIYIPSYTVNELAMFGQSYANAQDYVIGAEAQEVLIQKLAAMQEAGKAVAITEVIDIVGKAITRSNKFFRKMSMGKKRYDANDYIILFPKDFK